MLVVSGALTNETCDPVWSPYTQDIIELTSAQEKILPKYFTINVIYSPYISRRFDGVEWRI